MPVRAQLTAEVLPGKFSILPNVGADPCAAAGRITIAEVEELVEPGELTPAHVHTPGVFVKRVVEVGTAGKLIEKRTMRASSNAAA